MSVAVSSLTPRIRAKLDEMDSRRPIGVIRLHQELRDQYIAMMSRLPAHYSYTASAGTITAGQPTFTLPTTSSAEYAGDIRIQLTSTNTFLVKLSQEEMQRLRNSSTGTGRPAYFAPYESSAQSVICWVQPMAAADEAYNLFRSLVAADFSTTDIDATTLAVGRDGQTALVLRTSAALVKRPMFLKELDPDLRASAKELANEWRAEAERLEYLEYDRLSNIEAVGRIQRFQT